MTDYQTIGSWLNVRWNGVYANASGALIIPNIGKTACIVEVSETPDGLSRVFLQAPVLQGVRATAALMQDVATNATAWLYGAIGINEDDTPGYVNVQFEYPIPGRLLDADALNFFVAIVAQSAQSLIERMQPVHGGTTVYE